MIRALAFSVLATGAPHVPHAPSAPLTVIMQSIDGSSVTCPAQAMHWDLLGPTITGLACAGDLVFKNGFEVTK